VTTSHARDIPELVQEGTTNLTTGDFLQLEISDTGRGIPEDVKIRIFDPFFTTKSAGRGMGLSVVQGIIQAHRGTISVTSAPGQGTSFRILLPCTSEPAKQKQSGGSAGCVFAPSCRLGAGPGDNAAAAVNQGRFGPVLLVEDEEPLRQSVSEMLRTRGFSVVQAADGAPAVDLIRGQEGLDLILLDMTIPGTSSRELISEAERIRPNVKIILTSA
jgi:hypothetical protein